MSVLKRRGSTLANIMFMSVALFGLLVASSSTWLFQIGLSSRAAAAQGSRRLAEATAQTMVARLIKDPTLSATTLPSLTLALPSYPNGQGLLALKSQVATDLGIPLSINNLEGSGSLPGWGSTVVAPQQANLVAVGRFRQTECRLEVVLNVPAFPYVVGSSVPVKSLDGLTVFGVVSPAALAGGFDSIAEDQKVPGHLVTNALDQVGETALQLLGASRVEGDAQARGNIVLGTGASVTGEVRPLAESAPLPSVDVTSLDTASKPGNSDISSATLSNAHLAGFNRRSGDLAITGGLELDGGVVYVDGSLSIQGGLKGKGAVLATGPVSVQGGGSLTGDNQTAIVARGGVTLQGTPGRSSEFRGLIYTEGNLDCRYTKIAGSVVINNPNPAGTALLEQVQMVESQALSSLDIPVISTVQGAPPGLQTAADFGYHAYGFGFQQVGSTIPDIKLKWNAMDYDNPPAGYPVTHPPTAAEPWNEIGVPNPWPADPIPLAKVRSGICNASDYSIIGSWDEWRDIGEARAGMAAVVNDWPGPQQGNLAMVDEWLAEAQQRVINQVPEYVAVYNANARYLGQNRITISGTGTTTFRSSWKLDLSQFFNLSERIRILSWREL